MLSIVGTVCQYRCDVYFAICKTMNITIKRVPGRKAFKVIWYRNICIRKAHHRVELCLFVSMQTLRFGYMSYSSKRPLDVDQLSIYSQHLVLKSSSFLSHRMAMFRPSHLI